MSSGTCGAAVDEGDLWGKSCVRGSGHPGDHFGEPVPAQDKAPVPEPAEPCGMRNPDRELDCSYPSGHTGTGHQTRDEEGVLHTWYGAPPEVPSIPDSVRTRVRLHRAQTEYDLTVLKNRLDCMPTVTNVSKELRRRREQLTAELDAWTYLARVTERTR